MRFHLLIAATFSLGACSVDTAVGPFETDAPERFVSPPIPAVYPVPSPQQLTYQRMELNAFVHFGPNTFTGVEWGDGTADPDVFAPTDFDPKQWVDIFSDVGFRGLVFTAKHHDGFLMWPSDHSAYSVKSSSWRDGSGDVVGEVSAAAREGGLEVGFYLSPWDRNHESWGTPRYNDYFVATLWELIAPSISTYGPPFEVWLDGAHGSDVTQEQLGAYDSNRWLREIRWNAPGSVIALDHDVFWPGNEDGSASPTNWSVRDDFPRWAPYECDTSIRTNIRWFWHPGDSPIALDDLVDVYFRSVGRACTLLLNVPPDRRGLISPEDEGRLREWRAALDSIFESDFARGASVTASNTRLGSEGWSAGAAVDDDPDSFWVAEADTASVEIDLGRSRTVNVLELAEPIQYGQRVGAFRLDAWDGTAWTTAARGTTVNYKRLLRFPPITARRWRVVIEESRAVPALSQVGLYSALDWADDWSTREP